MICTERDNGRYELSWYHPKEFESFEIGKERLRLVEVPKREVPNSIKSDHATEEGDTCALPPLLFACILTLFCRDALTFAIGFLFPGYVPMFTVLSILWHFVCINIQFLWENQGTFSPKIWHDP